MLQFLSPKEEKERFIINCLTLLSLLRLDEFGPDVGPHNVGTSKVSHPEHQAELVVSRRDNSMFGEHQRLSSFVRLRDLYKHAAHLDREEGTM